MKKFERSYSNLKQDRDSYKSVDLGILSKFLMIVGYVLKQHKLRS